MDKKDIQILKDSALVVADQIASNLPGLNIAWGLSKALFGAGMKLREQRALEWVEMIRNNTDIFNENILKSENFQDAFVYSFEKYISERNESKRLIIKKIFLGFSELENNEQFEIERMIMLLSMVSIKGIELLKILKDVSGTYDGKFLSESLLNYLTKDSNDNPGKYNIKPNTNIREFWADTETDLISVGILRTYSMPKFGGTKYHDYDFTNIGKEFIKYILN